MKLLEVLSLDILESTRVVAGAAGLERDVRLKERHLQLATLAEK